MFATRKVKKTIVCARWRRARLARSSGRMTSIAAPVVPTHDASTVPIAISTQLVAGDPRSDPRT